MKHDNLLHKIYLTSRSSISRVLSRLVPPHEVEDIVQETYVRICQIDNKERIESPKSFMFKTARNLALDYLKQSNVRLVDRINDPQTLENLLAKDDSDEMYETAIIDKEFSQFCNAVRQLPVQCRRAFVLRKVYGFTQREIAEKMGISESTVEKHISKGMKQSTLYMRHQAETRQPLSTSVLQENKAGKTK